MHQPRIPVDFDWVEFLNIAKEMAEDNSPRSSQEAKLRCAISRAYYAAYHKARKIILPASSATGPGRAFGSHQQVIDALQESDDATRRKLGVDLNRLKGKRHKADYIDSVQNLPALAEDALIEAEELIDSLNAL